jgi:hypothetical protein
MAVVTLALVFAVIVLGVLMVAILRSHAEILRALHELGVPLDPDRDQGAVTAARRTPDAAVREGDSARASDIGGITPGGDAVAVAVTDTDERTLLAFLSSSCLTCRGFWESLGSQSQIDVPGSARVVIVTRDLHEESPASLAALASPGVLTVASSHAWDLYGVPGAPYFVLVDGPSGRIVGEGTGPTWDRVTTLLGQALLDAGEAPAPSRPTADDALSRAGIGPGHPSLYPEPLADAAEPHPDRR